jgi:hypothetical protein
VITNNIKKKKKNSYLFFLFKRYAAGGNNFSIFDIKDPEEETPKPETSK